MVVRYVGIEAMPHVIHDHIYTITEAYLEENPSPIPIHGYST